MDEKRSILIIDDDENICKTLSFIFKKKGFEVETVKTGKLALEKAQARYYNLALLDLKLPDINGLELLTPLKKMHPDMEVMMVTGFGSMESAMRALNMGASSYITKPLNMDEILSKISDKLEKQDLICAKRRTEKTLRESEEKFRNLFESNLDGISHVDMEGNFCDCNQAFLNMVGYTMEEIKALTIQQLTPQNWNKEDELAINQIIEKGYCDEYEKEYIKKDGTLLPVSLKGWSIKDEKGDLVGLWGIIRDITERKKKEEEIRMQSKIIENMSEGVNLIKLDDGTIVYTNPALEEMFGYNHGDLIGEDVAILNAQTDTSPEETKDKILGILKDTGEWHGEVLNIKKDGTPFWSYANVSLFDHPNYGRVIVAVLTDITERKKTEEEIAFLARFPSENPNLILRVTKKKVIYLNNAGETIFGIKEGDKLPELISDVVVEAIDENIIKVLELKLNNRIYILDITPIKEEGYVNIYGRDITELNKMMEQLRIKDIVFNASLSAQSTADINGVIDHVNPAFLELWGYKSSEEAIGNSVSSFFANPDDAVPILEALTETGKWKGEFLAKRCDGSRFISQGIASAIYNENGEQIGFQSTNLNITKRKEAELKLKKSEIKYRTLYESNLDGIAHVDMEGNFIDVNKTMLDMIGYTIEELKRKTFHALTPQKYSKEDEKAVNQILTKGYCDEYEKEHIRKNGTHIPINLKGWLERDDKGEPIGMWAIIRDITEHKRAEEQLQLERDNLFNILSSMEDGVYIVDQNYDIEYVNPTRVKDFGQYEGKKCYEYLHSRQGVCPWCKNQEVFNGNTVRWELYSIRNQKTYDNIDTPLKNIDGSTSKLKISRDITKLKKGEQDLLSALENLKSVNIELKRFAYVASHDLQEPLRMIVSFIQLLEKRYKDKLDKDAAEFIAFIVDGAKRMQKLINDLLVYSRIGRSDKPFKLIDINLVIASVINNLKNSIGETNAKITYDPLPTLMGNEAEFLQLLQNLISNAIKFHKEEEPPVVHISAKLKKNQWIFSVRDNGIGIDSQYFDRIFIIFQRLHAKDKFGGTGIGLTICKKIIERHMGKIWVESKLGKGSTFYFSIPKTEVRK